MEDMMGRREYQRIQIERSSERISSNIWFKYEPIVIVQIWVALDFTFVWSK